MLYYADTMQAKAMKLMASKLAVAGLIEGSFSEEGLAAMSDVRDRPYGGGLRTAPAAGLERP